MGPGNFPDRGINMSENQIYAVSGSYYWNCTPTHHACDPYKGVLHIESGDWGGASGTVFFQFVIGQLIYADQHNLLPFIHFDNFSHLVYDPQLHSTSGFDVSFSALGGAEVPPVRDPRMYHAIFPGAPKFSERRPNSTIVHLSGTGVWNHYFHPVSDYCPGDQSCARKPIVKMERALVSPGLHVYAPWSPKIWRYGPMPDYIGQPHLSLTEWAFPQRKRAAAIVQKYYRFQSTVVDHANPSISSDCLGVHIRWSDKGKESRRRLAISEFLPIIEAYIRAKEKSQTRMCVYLATDAQEVVNFIAKQWPRSIMDHFILSKATVRSSNETAVFDMDSHHKTNLEVLRDIWELSRCGFLVHGNSAVSESALYLNPTLIYQSVNLEDPEHHLRDPRKFEVLVYNVSQGTIDDDFWSKDYQVPRKWWEPASIERGMEVCLVEQNATSVQAFDLSAAWPESFIPVNRLVSRSFIKVWQELLAAKQVDVDPIWLSLFTSNMSRPCRLYLAELPEKAQDAVNSLSTNAFFNKRYKSVAQESESDSAAIRLQMQVLLNSQLLPQEHIRVHADKIFDVSAVSGQHSTCLGVHIPDPGYRRKAGNWTQQKYPQSLYEDFISAFIQAGVKCVYLATDSQSIWETFMAKNLSAQVFTQIKAVRNRHHVPAHFMEGSMQRLGSEAIVDIWNLQRCGFLVHGYSPVSEAALFWKPSLQSLMVQNRGSIIDFTASVHEAVTASSLPPGEAIVDSASPK